LKTAATPLFRFLALYAVLYAGFGVQAPYLPSLLQSRNLLPGAIALVLAAGTAIRLLAGPAAGHIADRLDAPRTVFAVLWRRGIGCARVCAGAGLGIATLRRHASIGRVGTVGPAL
jgi:PPP family 3-phenylpropionic acid transporter